MREILTFTDQEQIAGIVLDYADQDQWKVISDDVYDQRRWVTCHKAIVQRLSDGKYFVSHYSVGSTESVDQRAYEYDERVLKEVIPMEKTIITYGWNE